MPLTLLLFHGLRLPARSSIGLLTLLSLGFYGWWNPIYLLLIVPLIVANFALAASIVPRAGRRPRTAKPLLVLGIVLNLATLGYFKYANFFVDNLNAVAGLDVVSVKSCCRLASRFSRFRRSRSSWTRTGARSTG
jgi:D-alanyl-lipoteichoic acid acyltransferase DltB (MBOAT superfamily)